MLTTLERIKSYIETAVWDCSFKNEINAWVFIWYPEGDNFGHASLLIGDLSTLNTYVSWWPKKAGIGLASYLYKMPSDRTRVYNSETGDSKIVTASYIEDCLSEGYSPHVIYGLRGLDTRQMEMAWNTIVNKEKSSFSSLNKNCALVVCRVLKAGLRDSQLQHRLFGMFGGDRYIWTPKRIAVVCNNLRDNNLALKIKVPFRVAKKSVLKSIFRLR